MATIALTLDEFISQMSTKGTRFAMLLTVTRPKLNKRNRNTGELCPFPLGVERRSYRNVQLGAIYANSVNNQREREGNADEFTPQGLWVSKDYPNGAGERDSMLTVKHKGTGERYFAYKPASDSETGIALPPKVDSWVDVATGKVIEFESVKPYLPPTSEQPATQETDKMISWRTMKCQNVLQIKCGDDYILQH